MKKQNKFTKIVATIGPATETEEIIADLIKAGMNVARFNTKHGTPEWHEERIKRVRKVAKEMNVPIAVLLDLQGPEIRINLPGEQSFDLKAGQKAIFTSDDSRSDSNLVFIPQNVVETLEVGNLVLLDDGVCEFEIVKKEKKHLVAKAFSDFTVNHRKTMNTPGVIVEMPSLIENDYIQLDGAIRTGVDYVGLSFVRNKEDIKILRRELKKRNLRADIISKIENQAALDNIDEIIEASDAIMVARGDLAVEVPFEQLAFWQKLLIHKCREASKPVITATQMLKSMVDHPRPTRAEVTDIANAVYDCTSAVMLSEETTIGKYPVKAVETQAKIVAYNENMMECQVADWMESDSTACITHAAVSLLEHRTDEIDAIVCLTETGFTAKKLARFRPPVVIKAITSNEVTCNKLALLYGVDPHVVKLPAGKLETPQNLVKKLVKQEIIKPKQTVLVICGTIWREPGLTNILALVKS